MPKFRLKVFRAVHVSKMWQVKNTTNRYTYMLHIYKIVNSIYTSKMYVRQKISNVINKK